MTLAPGGLTVEDAKQLDAAAQAVDRRSTPMPSRDETNKSMPKRQTD
jgi:hypothetical protein